LFDLSAFEILSRFTTNYREYFGKQEFWHALVLNLQTDASQTDTNCLLQLQNMDSLQT
jgi:hypothetical protein